MSTRETRHFQYSLEVKAIYIYRAQREGKYVLVRILQNILYQMVSNQQYAHPSKDRVICRLALIISGNWYVQQF